ncbi:MAG: hypothetical protein V4649_17750 [Bacteroidota bacterium]
MKVIHSFLYLFLLLPASSCTNSKKEEGNRIAAAIDDKKSRRQVFTHALVPDSIKSIVIRATNPITCTNASIDCNSFDAVFMENKRTVSLNAASPKFQKFIRLLSRFDFSVAYEGIDTRCKIELLAASGQQLEAICLSGIRGRFYFSSTGHIASNDSLADLTWELADVDGLTAGKYHSKSK